MFAHNLLGRPGFMADPLVDTAQNLFANAHCNCPTRLDGFQQPPAEYVLRAHHAGGSWVSPQVLWRIGQVFTLARFQRPDMLLVDRAKVVCNYDSPPSAACITNTGAIVEGAEDDRTKSPASTSCRSTATTCGRFATSANSIASRPSTRGIHACPSTSNRIARDGKLLTVELLASTSTSKQSFIDRCTV